MAKKSKNKGLVVGADVKPTKIKKTLKEREAAEKKDRKNLERRMKKRGSYVGSPH